MDWNPSHDPVWLLSIVVRHWESTILLVNSAAGRVRTSWSAPSGSPSLESLAHRESGSASRKSGYSCCSSDGTDHRGTGSPAPRRFGGPPLRWSLCSRSVCFVETETDRQARRGHVAKFQTLRWTGRDGHRRQTPSQTPQLPSGIHPARSRWCTRWSSTCRTRSGWPARGFPSRSAAARRFRCPLAPRGSWGRADCREARSRTSQQHPAGANQSVSQRGSEGSFVFFVGLIGFGLVLKTDLIFFSTFSSYEQAVHETMITEQGYGIELWVQIWNCWAEFWTNLTPIETMIDEKILMMMVMVVLAQYWMGGW